MAASSRNVIIFKEIVFLSLEMQSQLAEKRVEDFAKFRFCCSGAGSSPVQSKALLVANPEKILIN